MPVSQLHVITRYAGADPEAVDLHRLGSGQWDKAKKKAAQQVRDTAAELLALYAPQRAARTGHKFSFKTHDLDAFAEAFGFEETADQQAAIDAVIKDMQQYATANEEQWQNHRIVTRNTGMQCDITVLTPSTPEGRQVSYEGDARIDGVPGRSAPITINFLDTAGSVCSGLFLPAACVTGCASSRRPAPISRLSRSRSPASTTACRWCCSGPPTWVAPGMKPRPN